MHDVWAKSLTLFFPAGNQLWSCWVYRFPRPHNDSNQLKQGWCRRRRTTDSERRDDGEHDVDSANDE